MVLPMYRLVSVLHRWDVVTHVHYWVGWEQWVRIYQREKITFRVARWWRTKLILVVNIQVFRWRRWTWLWRIRTMIDWVVWFHRLIIVVVSIVTLIFRSVLVSSIIPIRAVLLFIACWHNRTRRPFVFKFNSRFALDISWRCHWPITLMYG